MTNEKQPTDVKAAEVLAKTGQYMLETKDEKFSWKAFKDKFVRYFGALFMEKNKQNQWVVSVGRTSWWLAFLPALYIFMTAFADAGSVESGVETISKDITPNHLTILLALAGYNFSKRITDAATSIWSKNKDGPG